MDPYIFRRHRWRKELLERLYERRNFRHAAAIHFTTQEEMELARAALHFSKGIVIPLGLWVEDYRRPQTEGTFRRLFPEVGQRRIILFLSRLNFKKGLDLLIPAVGKLSRRRDDIHLVVAGPEEDGFGKNVLSAAGWLNLTSGKAKTSTLMPRRGTA
jgi:glycosyltransferase involved in cell wall biosynthesis